MSKITKPARRVYGLLAPAADASTVPGGQRGAAWVGLVVTLAWLVLTAWMTWQSAVWALDAWTAPFAVLLWGLAVFTGLAALAFAGVAGAIVLSGALGASSRR